MESWLLTWLIYIWRVGGSRAHSKGSLSSEAKVPPESDTDSMAEYGEGEAGTISFIMQANTLFK